MTRLAAQQMINNQKAIKKEVNFASKKPVLVNQIRKSTWYTGNQTKILIGIMCTQTEGCVQKGATGVCRRKRTKRLADEDMELPDLQESSPPPIAQPGNPKKHNGNLGHY